MGWRGKTISFPDGICPAVRANEFLTNSRDSPSGCLDQITGLHTQWALQHVLQHVPLHLPNSQPSSDDQVNKQPLSITVESRNGQMTDREKFGWRTESLVE